jgi:hypothetical protein
MPSVLSKSPRVETDGEARVFDYGNLNDNPIAAELVVATLPHSVPTEQLDEFLDSARRELQSVTPPDAERQGDARIVTVGAHRFVSVTHVFKNRVTMRSWATALDDRQVVLRVFLPPDRPAAWVGIEDKMVASLQRQ